MMGDDESAQLRGGRGDKREPPPVAAACPRRLGQPPGGAPGDAGEHRQGKHGARPDQRRPPGWAYWARSAITQEASTLARSALTRTAGTINASPPAATEATAEPSSANQAAIASRGAASGHRARTSAAGPAGQQQCSVAEQGNSDDHESAPPRSASSSIPRNCRASAGSMRSTKLRSAATRSVLASSTSPIRPAV
jgi:hypothetical protein